MTDRKRVLILCTGNSCRSQMAEGWINRLLGDRWRASSGGTRPAARVDPRAVRAMAEVGIDVSGARPEPVDAHVDERWDLVVTVCDSARELCPVFPGAAETIHVGFEDPVGASGSDEEQLEVYRRVRDEIRQRLLPEIEARG